MAGFETIELADSAAYLREGGQDTAVIEASGRLTAAGADAVVVAGATVAGIAHRLCAHVSCASESPFHRWPAAAPRSGLILR